MKEGFLKYIYLINRCFLLQIIFPFFRLLSQFASSKILRHIYGVNFLKERSYNDIFPLKKIEFEGVLFNAPYDCDAYLKKIYGDYMIMPEKIEVHIVDGKIRLW